MREMLVLFSNMAAGWVRIFLCLYLISRLLSSKKPGKRCVALAFFGVVVLSVIVSVTGLPQFYPMALEALWITFCAGYFLGADKRMSLFVGIFFEIAVSFLGFLISAWSGVLFGSPAFLDSGTGRGQAALWLCHGVLAVLGLYLLRHPYMKEKEGIRFVSVIVVTGFLAVVTLSQQTVPGLTDDTLSMWMILAVILVMAILVFQMNRHYEMEKELARLKSQQSQLLERDYTALKHVYEANARLFHDFHNHMGVLCSFLSLGKTREALEYLEELQAPVGEFDTLWTGDETLDYLINSKAKAAKAMGILYHVAVEFPRNTNLRSADLCAILGNLLDNAIEAAGQVSGEKEGFVRLTIRRIHQMLVIKVENSYKAPPVKKEGVLVTSKEDNGLHGWGLKSARTAAEKYEGTVQTSYSGGTFQAVATLSFHGVKTGREN